MEINTIELMALKKLALINGALAQGLSDPSSRRETRALLGVLVDVIARAELANHVKESST